MIKHFYHVHSATPHGRDITLEHLQNMYQSGLLDAVDKIYVGFVGPVIEIENPKIEVLESVEQGWEQTTMRHIQELVEDDDKVLYAHTKGAYNHTPINNRWRKAMESVVTSQWDKCVALLDSNDAVGPHLLTAEKYPGRFTTPIFGGNFWWANGSYLKTLPKISEDSRWDAEYWIGLNYPKTTDLLPGWPGTYKS